MAVVDKKKMSGKKEEEVWDGAVSSDKDVRGYSLYLCLSCSHKAMAFVF